jgi:hypothetical protein
MISVADAWRLVRVEASAKTASRNPLRIATDESNSVRVIDAFVPALDLAELSFDGPSRRRRVGVLVPDSLCQLVEIEKNMLENARRAYSTQPRPVEEPAAALSQDQDRASPFLCAIARFSDTRGRGIFAIPSCVEL